MGLVRIKQGIAAIVAATVMAGGVAICTAASSPRDTAVPVERQPERASRAQEPSAAPTARAAEPTAALTPVRLPAAAMMPTFTYPEDFFLPRPVSREAYYDPSLGHAGIAGDGTLAIPVNGRRTSPFGMRFHPVLFVYKLHTGLDFAAPCGTPIGAAADGRVTRVGWAGGNGFMVTVSHGQIAGYDVVTNYAHLSSAGVRVGDVVRRQQGIGRVGNTGYSTGCHLHFEVLADGQYTDPASWLGKGGVIVFADGMAEFGPGPEPSGSASPSDVPSESPGPQTTDGAPSGAASATAPVTPVEGATDESPAPSPTGGSPDSTPSATESPTPTPTPSDEPTPTPTPTPSATATPTPTGTPTETPASPADRRQASPGPSDGSGDDQPPG